MKKYIWITWIGVSLSIAFYFSHALFVSEDKSDFLIGDTTYGHYQIELACEACHIEPFGGTEILQDACENCHAQELADAHDSHPKKKFSDPREAYRLEIIDARYCISCHAEHQQEQTRAMGVTLPDDYCYHCHKEITSERESHKDLPFDSCASAGCHNYHDNRALYEEFLVENSGQDWLKAIATIDEPNLASLHAGTSRVDVESPLEKHAEVHPEIHAEWQVSSHAQAGVVCENCHMNTDEDVWIEKPGIEQCETCHANETSTYKQGKHGMRLSVNDSFKLETISPKESHMAFTQASMDSQHGCNACHSAHSFEPSNAAVRACLTCHADEHSLAFLNSPHGNLWQQAEAGEIDMQASVSCASCHMPRTHIKVQGKPAIYVNHNQNLNLRPNEKMIRGVCMSCHGLEFSIDALADEELIKNNFTGRPGTHIESVDWALDRVKEK